MTISPDTTDDDDTTDGCGPCEFPGENHDESFPCHVCDRLVCGYCADAGNGSEWFCPDCLPTASITQP